MPSAEEACIRKSLNIPQFQSVRHHEQPLAHVADTSTQRISNRQNLTARVNYAAYKCK